MSSYEKSFLRIDETFLRPHGRIIEVLHWQQCFIQFNTINAWLPLSILMETHCCQQYCRIHILAQTLKLVAQAAGR